MENEFIALDEASGVSVHSGFPNPSTSRLSQALALDLNQLVISRPSSTYLFRITGHNYASQGIYDGDIVVVERGKLERPQDLVVIWDDNNFRLNRRRQLAANETGWGVVLALIRKLV